MFRKIALPLVAALALGGCATYGYDNPGYGNGDYYYGRGGGYGPYGDGSGYVYDRYGRYGYYDRYGRFIEVRPGGGYYGGYGYPGGYYGGYGSGGYYGGYGYPGGYYGGYGYPGGYYGYGYPGNYYPYTTPRPVTPRPPRPDNTTGQPDTVYDAERDERRPIWRDLRRIGQRPQMSDQGGDLPQVQGMRSPMPRPTIVSPVDARPMSVPSTPSSSRPTMPSMPSLPRSSDEPRGGMMGRQILRNAERRALGEGNEP